MKRLFISLLPAILAGCAAEPDDAATRESPANAIDAPVVDATEVRLRLEIAVQVPEDVRPNLAVLVNGEAQRMVDVRVEPQPDPPPDADADAVDREPAPVMTYSTVEYERMMAWGANGASHDRIVAVDARSNAVVAEMGSFLEPICSLRPPPLPTEVYYRAILAYVTLSGADGPSWNFDLTGWGCLYADPERNYEAVF